jgi:hypothetical protein
MHEELQNANTVQLGVFAVTPPQKGNPNKYHTGLGSGRRAARINIILDLQLRPFMGL